MISRLRSYPAYKPSGVEWLGDVPERWDARRGGWLFNKMDRPVRDADEVITCFRDGTVTLRKNRRTEGFTESLKEIGYQGVRKGDLVIHQMDAFAGAVGVSDSDGKGTPVYSVCHPTQDADPFYYAHVVREMARNQWILALAKGIRERSTDFRYSEFAKQALPVPPLAEQHAIVRYLDHMDRRIRRYVAAKRKLIALLEEEKQAVINRAVTRGLDPNVRLKPSGVEWLGVVPEHWAIERLSTSVESLINGVWGSDPDGTDDLPCIRVADFDRRKHRILTDKLTPRLVKHSERSGRILRRGDLLIEKSGGGEKQPVGTVMLYDHDFQSVCSNFVGRMVLRKSYDPRYQTYLHATLYAIGVNKRSIKQTTGIQNIDASSYLSEFVGVPPTQEQASIVRYLDRETAKTDAVIARTHRQVELVEEYRTKLIADVVTGKLDVRAVAAQLPDDGDDQDPIEEGGLLTDGLGEDLYGAGGSAEELAIESGVTV